MSRAKPSTKPAEQAAAPALPATQEPTSAPEPVSAPAPSIEQLVAAYVPPAEPAPAPPVEPLDDFLRRIECAHIDRDVYAVAATHPEATARIWPGTYSGIRLSRGDVSVTYSDGSQA